MDIQKLAAIKTVHETTLKYQIEYEIEDLYQILAEIGKYNEFDPREVIKFITKIQDMYSDIAPTFDHIRFIFGREYSPVLYIKTAYCDEKFQAYVKRVALASLKCVEYNTEINSYGEKDTIRIWWD